MRRVCRPGAAQCEESMPGAAPAPGGQRRHEFTHYVFYTDHLIRNSRLYTHPTYLKYSKEVARASFAIEKYSLF